MNRNQNISLLRMCKVLTDMPAERDRPIDFGVSAFCERCKKCAIHCPAGAISHGAPGRFLTP